MPGRKGIPGPSWPPWFVEAPLRGRHVDRDDLPGRVSADPNPDFPPTAARPRCLAGGSKAMDEWMILWAMAAGVRQYIWLARRAQE